MKNLNRTIAAKPLLPTKVLQFGSGNFLRGFVDYIIAELNDQGLDGGIAVVKNRPGLSMLDLQQQDGIFTLFTEGIKNREVIQHSRLITCTNTLVNPYDSYEAYLDLATEAELKLIVSNTTEAGIYFDPSDAHLTNGPHNSFAAKLTALLYKRYVFFNGAPEKGLFVLPCELIENNGKVLREIVLQYAALWHLADEFVDWLLNHTRFYNTLVDRIVSGYPKENDANYTAQLDYTDKLITICEPYLFWAIEGDASLADHFPFQHFGDQIVLVDDLTPYRLRKVRILNGAHTIMAQIGRLQNLKTVGDCMQNEFTYNFILKAIREEILPTMPLQETNLEQYTDEVLDRFKNPYLRHYLSDIAQNTIVKFKTRLLPAIVDYIGIKHTYPKHLMFALAALIHLNKKEWDSWLLANPIESHMDSLTKIASNHSIYDEVVLRFMAKYEFADHRLKKDNFSQPLSSALEIIDVYGLESGYSKF